MTILSDLRSSRFARQQKNITQSLIVFTLRREWFALPIDMVQKVIPLGAVYGDPQGTGISLTEYQNKEVVVIDVASRIFKQNKAKNLTNSSYLLILNHLSLDLVGLPVESVPQIRRVAESAFVPIPDTYLNKGNINCLSSAMIQLQDHPSLFLLDAQELMAEI